MKRLCVLPVLCAASLAACGSSAPMHNPTSEQAARLSAWRAAVRCAREHGMAGLPDPVLNADGRVTLPGLSQAPTPTPTAQSACGAQIRVVTSTAPAPPSESAADVQALVQFAACMRTHGYGRWPDPRPDGSFHVRSADAGTPARLDKAFAACRRLIPPGGWRLSITPSGQ